MTSRLDRIFIEVERRKEEERISAGERMTQKKRVTPMGEKGEQVALCSDCGKRPANPPHTCPYAHEINDDDTFQCDCCDDCISECAMGI